MAKGDRNRILADANITHQIYIQRNAQSNGNAVIKIIDSSENGLLKYISKRLDKFGPVIPSKATTRKINAFEKDVAKIRGQAIKKAEDYLTGELDELAKNESVFSKKSIDSVVDDITTKAPPKLLLDSIVNNGIFSGRNKQEWFTNLGVSDVGRIMSQVRSGMAQGLTTPQIVQGLRGTAKANYKDGLLQITRNEANTIARTLTNGVANSARFATFAQNSDIINGVTYSATLDGRTSDICMALDGTTWKFPQEAGDIKTPPLHPNCRSTLIPEVEGLEKLNAERPGANSDFNSDAERRYNEAQKAKGSPKRYSDLAPATREKYYYKEIQLFQKETGKPAFTPVKGTIPYSTYLARQPERFQRDVLGDTKYQLFKAGGYTLDKFVDFKTGRPFSIADLKAKDKEGVENAQRRARDLKRQEREAEKLRIKQEQKDLEREENREAEKKNKQPNKTADQIIKESNKIMKGAGDKLGKEIIDLEKRSGEAYQKMQKALNELSKDLEPAEWIELNEKYSKEYQTLRDQLSAKRKEAKKYGESLVKATRLKNPSKKVKIRFIDGSRQAVKNYKPLIDEAITEVSKYSQLTAKDDPIMFELNGRLGAGSGSWSSGRRSIELGFKNFEWKSDQSLKNTIRHEIFHLFSSDNDQYKTGSKIQAFFEKRLKEKPTELTKMKTWADRFGKKNRWGKTRQGADYRGYKDLFYNEYSCRAYTSRSGRIVQPTEEFFVQACADLNDPEKIFELKTKDPELFDFVIGILNGKL